MNGNLLYLNSSSVSLLSSAEDSAEDSSDSAPESAQLSSLDILRYAALKTQNVKF